MVVESSEKVAKRYLGCFAGAHCDSIIAKKTQKDTTRYKLNAWAIQHTAHPSARDT